MIVGIGTLRGMYKMTFHACVYVYCSYVFMSLRMGLATYLLIYHVCTYSTLSYVHMFTAIEVSVKPASSSQLTTKRVTLNLTGAVPAVESVQDMSNSGHKTVNVCTHIHICTYITHIQ